MRWLALVAAAALLVVAFAAAGRVTDSREGLVAEIVTLLAGAAGFVLLIYSYAARGRPAVRGPSASASTRAAHGAYSRSGRDLLLGGAGIALAIILVTGLAVSGGPLWAGFGLAIVLPMLAGSVYLCVRYLRANP